MDLFSGPVRAICKIKTTCTNISRIRDVPDFPDLAGKKADEISKEEATQSLDMILEAQEAVAINSAWKTLEADGRPALVDVCEEGENCRIANEENVRKDVDEVWK